MMRGFRILAARAARAASVAAVAVAVATTVAGCTGGGDAVNQMSGTGNGFVTTADGTKVFAAGSRPAAPNVAGTLLDGSSYTLASDRGHIVVLNFWGSWCAPCRVEAADLQSVHAATESQGVDFVGVNERDDQGAAVDYQRSHGITYPSISDGGGHVALQFRDVPPSAIPSTIVLDATGRIAAIHLGSITRAELAELIAKAGS
jgi:thiol-disulfide isomerase/thioredoxin